jgi:hypothetical protein
MMIDGVAFDVSMKHFKIKFLFKTHPNSFPSSTSYLFQNNTSTK